MNIAINLATIQKGKTGENPYVGCVVTKNNQIISYGSTQTNGRPHAEVDALKKINFRAKGSTVYLTLEPCTHYGKTPPCVNVLIKSKVKKVIYSINDQDKRTFNKAIKFLRSKKIDTAKGLLSNKASKLYNHYNYAKKNKIPYIIGKLACSKDYKFLYNNTLITNEHSRKVSHLLRYQNQAILTSYKVINSDNPKLTCRLNGLEQFSPIILIIDRDLKVNANSYIFKNKKALNKIIFYNSNNLKKINKVKKLKKVKMIKVDFDKKYNLDLNKLLKKIYSLSIYSVIVECGKELTSKMITNKLFNEFYLFKSEKNFRLVRDNVLSIIKKVNKNFKKKMFVDTYLDKNVLIKYF